MPPSPPLPRSPAGSNFVPRREFNSSVPVPATFCLLAFGTPNFIRLTNFPSPIVKIVQAVLDARGLVKLFKEDRQYGLSKFILSDKLWSSPKTIQSETLVVEILTAVLADGYHFLSLIDYGKETGDILSLVFSRPIPPALAPPGQASLEQLTCHVPFGISFVSASVVRVIHPPLGHTPAILRAVREAWPRGVISERKVGHTTFEFKLKKQSLFADDTFYEDSIQHIMKLLSTLSLAGFNLLTSLSFSPGRSGIKDMWVLVGTDVRPVPAMHDNKSMPNVPSLLKPVSSHVRNASLDGRPPELPRSALSSGHARNATAPAGSTLLDGDSDSSLDQRPRHAATDPMLTRQPTALTRYPIGRSPLSRDIPLPLPLGGEAFADTSSVISWDDGEDEPSPLAQSPDGEDGSSTQASPGLVTPPQPVQVVAPSSLKSLYAPIEEAPDLRATQILYATPPPPRLTPPGVENPPLEMRPPLETAQSDTSTLAPVPGGPAPA